MRALFVLTPAESKRLIGKAVANLEEVKKAKTDDQILIGHGSTNVYVAEEVVGRKKLAEIMNRSAYLSGVITRGTLCTTLGDEKPPILILNRGVPIPPAPTMSEMLRDFNRDSIFVKGANAVDPEGNAAVFMAHPEGGTIGWSIGAVIARGIRLIVPVGLEKLIPSVKKATESCGQQTYDYCQGLRVGLIPLSGAKVVTEIVALKILAGVDTLQVASGGNTGSEGSVTLVSEGDPKAVEKAIQLVESVKGEQPMQIRKGICETCSRTTSPVEPKGYTFKYRGARCQFENKKDSEIPEYLR
jgi:hypothetical protein